MDYARLQQPWCYKKIRWKTDSESSALKHSPLRDFLTEYWIGRKAMGHRMQPFGCMDYRQRSSLPGVCWLG